MCTRFTSHISYENITKRVRFGVGRPCPGSFFIKKDQLCYKENHQSINQSINPISIARVHITYYILKHTHTIRISLLRILWFESRMYFVVAKFICLEISQDLSLIVRWPKSDRNHEFYQRQEILMGYIDAVNSIESLPFVGVPN